jgi:ATP-dependent helicase/nuclease subunit A
MTQLTLVPAGAGSGKTYTIEHTLAGWIADGSVKASRILAVTFTEAAASELRGRIRTKLMKEGRVDDALELDRAYVGTIHSLGQRILTEQAFAAGRSPTSRLISEAERDLIIRRLIPKATNLQPLMQDLRRYGFDWDAYSGKGAEDKFRETLLATVDLLRGFGRRATDPKLLIPAIAALDDGYGKPANDGDALTDALRRAVQTLFEAFPDGLAASATSKSARNEFLRDHRNVKKAANTKALNSDWKLWQSLRDLRRSKRGAATPEGYDALAEAVMEAADVLPRHPGPLSDAKTHLSALVKGAQQILNEYEEVKRSAGLIDYADMIAETENLLRQRPEIRDAVLAEIDCVVIDEFQDTNPVQFSLLWLLAKDAKRALIVGDTKQSIMGFQGADARLSDALHKAYSEAVSPLDKNWRSVPGVMNFVNGIGPALFPESYVLLEPQREPTRQVDLEVINLPSSRKDPAANCIADRIESLLNEDVLVRDRTTEEMRPLKTGDIAVLCPTHARGAAVADSLRSIGIEVRIPADGWLEAPATRATRAALAYVADPTDLHAAIRFLTLGPPGEPLEAVMRAAIYGELFNHERLMPLRELSAQTEALPVSELLARTAQAANLREWSASLPDGVSSLADLDRLLAEALEFDQMETELRSAAGFNGFGPQVFLGWINSQTQREWDLRPSSDGWIGEGVEIATWHAAKGREWPIVIVSGLNSKIAERAGSLRAEFEGFDNLDDVLASSGLGWLPNFAAKEVQEKFASARQEAEERAAARELYVAFTRARDRLIIAMPKPPKTEKPRAETAAALLRDRTAFMTSDDSVVVCDQTFPAKVHDYAEMPEFDASHTLPPAPALRFGIERPATSGARTPWRKSPSSLKSEVSSVGLTNYALAEGLGGGLDGLADAAERGVAWHLAFRTFLLRPDLSTELSKATGLSSKTLERIEGQVAAVRDWLESNGYPTLKTELPIQERRSDGSETNAVIDLLAIGEDGALIIDLKSGSAPNPEVRFAEYLPQLESYSRLVESELKQTVRGRAVFWLSEGVMSIHGGA